VIRYSLPVVSNQLTLWCIQRLYIRPNSPKKRGGIDLSIKHIFFIYFLLASSCIVIDPMGLDYWIFHSSARVIGFSTVVGNWNIFFVYYSTIVRLLLGFFFSLQPLSLLNATGSTMWRGCVVVGIQCSIELVKGYFFFRSPSKYTGVLAYRHVFFFSLLGLRYHK
jgi:hypothetical protein